MLQLNNVSFTYPGGLTAIKDVSTEITPGLHLLLGENGAGKTTLLHLLSGLRFPTAGSVTVNGIDVTERLPQMYADLLFVGESMDMPTSTIRDFARIHSPFYPGFDEDVFSANLREFGMTGDELLRNLSFGTRHKAILAYVLSLGCATLLLDEPANGLDITARKTLRALLARCMNEDSTVIVSTHTVGDFEALFDGVIVILDGQVVLNMSTARIASRILFERSPIPPRDAIYFEQDLGSFLSIVPNTEGRETDINFGLLYSGLLSNVAPKILSILTNE